MPIHTVPPLARTLSRARSSVDSIASENSLPNVPVSETAIARMRANGPSPTALTKTSAQISVSMPRIVSSMRLYQNAQRVGRRGIRCREQRQRYAHDRDDQRAEKRDRQGLGHAAQ